MIMVLLYNALGTEKERCLICEAFKILKIRQVSGGRLLWIIKVGGSARLVVEHSV